MMRSSRHVNVCVTCAYVAQEQHHSSSAFNIECLSGYIGIYVLQLLLLAAAATVCCPE